jgi:transposase
MKQDSSVWTGVTVGLDLGDKSCRYCVLGADGAVLRRGTVPTASTRLEAVFRRWPTARLVLEVGTHSAWIHRLAERVGQTVVMANPRKVRAIAASSQKSDERDAELLARLGRVDPRLLCPVQPRREQVQADLAVVRARDGAVRCRTQLANTVRGLAKAQGVRLPCVAPASLPRQAAALVPATLQPALQPLLLAIGELTRQIRQLEATIDRMATERYPETEVISQVAGVGNLTALAFVLTLGDPQRFTKSRQVGAYLGLTPRRDQSGGRDPALSITKAGDELMRRLLVQSAHYILGPFGPDTDLRRWGLGLAARGGKNAKRRAIVAVARRLAVLLHRLWVTGARYEPLRLAERAAA